MRRTPRHVKPCAEPRRPPSSWRPTVRASRASWRCCASSAWWIDTHIAALGGASGVEVTRWFYRQRMKPLSPAMRAPVSPPRCRNHAVFAGDVAPAQIERIAVELPALRTTVLGTRSPEQSSTSLRNRQRRRFTGWGPYGPMRNSYLLPGRLDQKTARRQTHAAEAGELILEFLHASNASLGSSNRLSIRAATASPSFHFLPISTRWAKPGRLRGTRRAGDLLPWRRTTRRGWRFIGERRAISLDPNCGWTRGKADVVYVPTPFKLWSV